jgi:hypothetical protein
MYIYFININGFFICVDIKGIRCYTILIEFWTIYAIASFITNNEIYKGDFVIKLYSSTQKWNNWPKNKIK